MAPDDKEALECKLVLLIQKEEYAEALALCDRVPDRQYERAYCLYRLQQLVGEPKPAPPFSLPLLTLLATQDNALTIVRGGKRTTALRELEAQVLYRMERYADAVAVYRDLLRAAQVLQSNGNPERALIKRCAAG